MCQGAKIDYALHFFWYKKRFVGRKNAHFKIVVCDAGALEYLMEKYDLSKMQFVGASAGALIATIAACDVEPELAVQSAYRSMLY